MSENQVVETLQVQETVEEQNNHVADQQEAVESEQSQGAQLSEETDDEPKSKVKKGVQRRIDQLTRQIYELKAENEQLKNGSDGYDYEDLDEDNNQLPVKKYNIKAIAAEQFRQFQQQQKAEQLKQLEAQRQQEIHESWQEKFAEAQKKYPDYAETVNNSNVRIPQEAVDIIMYSESGADIAYYLGKNPHIAESLNTVPPGRVAYEMGRLEAKVISEMAKKRVTTAPKPPSTVAASKSSPAADLNKMSPEEYARYMNQREYERRKQRGY